MGRRSLPKIDPELDLSHHLYELEMVPQPLDLTAWFGRSAPVELEVGSGKGLFLQTATVARPEHDFIGVEIIRKYARFTAFRLAKQQQGNAKVIRGDARAFLVQGLPDACLFAVHVYFPDPWWKKRHHKRRLLDAPFLQEIERVLMPNGQLHFWTDVEAYFAETLSIIAQETQLAGPHGVAESPAQHDLDYRTHFESRMRLHDLPVYRAEFSKVAAPHEVV